MIARWVADPVRVGRWSAGFASPGSVRPTTALWSELARAW